jgi:hypothetical protein
MTRDGGCLLADDVGEGKTYVALAVARTWTRPLVIVPASLRSTWTEAMHRAGVTCTLASHESLSRGSVPAVSAGGIIVDESHRFRSPSARRYRELAILAAHTRLLLLSATPLHNSTRDLAAQLALFLGTRASTLDAAELARFVVRRPDRASSILPAVAPPRWVRPATDDGAVLRAILALPPPTRPLDGGDGGVLRTMSLVRAWASSRAALTAMLRRRRQVATAIEQSVAAGLLPTKRELRAWQGHDTDVQLGFAPLLVEASLGSESARELADAVGVERDALEALVRLVAERPDPDASRVDALRAIRSAHPDERVLAFSELASTVRAYYAAMRADKGVGMLTATDARIASGRLPRVELLARFAPCAQGSTEPPPRERVTLLLATDLLSEGVNLQDASVVVHLDLPWNPQRLAQRVGRVRRPGGAATVHAYLLAPPAETELLLQVETRLRRKLARAERTIGRALHVVPHLGPREQASTFGGAANHEETSAATLGALAERIAGWRPDASDDTASVDHLTVAAAHADRQGWLVALDDGRLLASLDGAAPHLIASVAAAAALAEGPARPLREREASVALAEARRWIDAECLAHDCGLRTASDTLQVTLERRIAQAVRRAPRHERADIIALASRLRDALRLPRSLGAERALAAVLADGARSTSDDRRCLRTALDIASNVRGRREWSGALPRVLALIVFGPISHEID